VPLQAQRLSWKYEGLMLTLEAYGEVQLKIGNPDEGMRTGDE